MLALARCCGYSERSIISARELDRGSVPPHFRSPFRECGSNGFSFFHQAGGLEFNEAEVCLMKAEPSFR